MQLIFGLLIAVIAAIVCAVYVPSPIGWIVALVILLIVAYVAVTGRRAGP
jgi:hypothetical protein